MSFALIVAVARGVAFFVSESLHGDHWLKLDVDGAGVGVMDYFISLTQIAAFLFELQAAITFLRRGRSWPNEEQWLQSIAAAAPAAEASGGGEIPVAVAASMASAQVRRAARAARRDTAIFWCQLSFVYAWFMFATSSIKMEFPAHTNWATLFSEVGMVYYLYLMYEGVVLRWSEADDCERLAQAVRSGTTPVHSPAALPLLHAAAQQMESRGPTGEQSAPAALPLAPWGALPASDPFGAAACRALLADLVAAQHGLRAAVDTERVAISQELERRAADLRRRGWLECASLVLNTIAFMGFMPLVVEFFFSETSISQVLPFYPPLAVASAQGVFIGTLAWTLDPALHLVVPPALDRRLAAERAASAVPPVGRSGVSAAPVVVKAPIDVPTAATAGTRKRATNRRPSASPARGPRS